MNRKGLTHLEAVAVRVISKAGKLSKQQAKAVARMATSTQRWKDECVANANKTALDVGYRAGRTVGYNAGYEDGYEDGWMWRKSGY